MDIMAMLIEWSAGLDKRIDAENVKIRDTIQARIQAMQEVCDAAIKCKRLGMNPDLYDAVAKLEALK